MDTQLAPTTKANVRADGSVNFYCTTELSDTEKILIYVEVNNWDRKQNKYVEVTEKFQLESISYSTNYKGAQVTCDGGVIRGFTKDGKLRVRTTWIPINQRKAVIAQIPDHYHDYARQAFENKMRDLQQTLTLMTNGGIQI